MDLRPRSRCRLRTAATAILFALGWTSAASAYESTDSDAIRELQARVEAMERQNRQLLEALRAQHILQTGVDSTEPSPLENGEQFSVDGILPPHDTGSESTICVPSFAPPRNPFEMNASWHNGLQLETADHRFRVHVGGRTQFVVGWFNAADGVQASLPPNARFRDGVDFRRARLRVDGVMYDTMEWTVEYDFVNSAGVPNVISLVAPTDLWWQFNRIPVLQHFRIGNQKEPIGFEHLTSSRFLNFIERSFLQDAFFGGFNNGFTPGAQFFGTAAEDRMTWAAGIFTAGTNLFAFNLGPSEYAITGRLTALPWYEDEGRELLHVGGAARYWTLDDGQARFRTRASVRTGLSANWPIIADTGIIDGADNQQLNAELVGVYGPWSFAAEFLTSWLQGAQVPIGADRGTLIYRGGYVEVLCFLTGEHRAYNRQTGVFDRVIPKRNAFFAKGTDGNTDWGLGAWQLAARQQFLDLNSNGVNGGILHDTTLGINWYFNPNFKVQANYFYLQRDGFTGDANGPVQGFGFELAHDF